MSKTGAAHTIRKRSLRRRYQNDRQMKPILGSQIEELASQSTKQPAFNSEKPGGQTASQAASQTMSWQPGCRPASQLSSYQASQTASQPTQSAKNRPTGEETQEDTAEVHNVPVGKSSVVC
jgi:hypothetical protein